MKSHSDYVKDFDRAWDDPATIAENCWRREPHDKHLWRRVHTNDYPDVDETMRKCVGYCDHEFPKDQCAVCLKQDEPEKPLTFQGLITGRITRPSSHFHAEGNDAKDL